MGPFSQDYGMYVRSSNDGCYSGKLSLDNHPLQFQNTEGKLADIASSITSAVNSRCQCSLTVNHLTTQLFLCISDQQVVLYRAELSGRPDCAQILSYIEQWVNGSQKSLLVQSNIIEVYHDCPIEVDSLLAQADCATPTSNTATATRGMSSDSLVTQGNCVTSTTNTPTATEGMSNDSLIDRANCVASTTDTPTATGGMSIDKIIIIGTVLGAGVLCIIVIILAVLAWYKCRIQR